MEETCLRVALYSSAEQVVERSFSPTVGKQFTSKVPHLTGHRKRLVFYPKLYICPVEVTESTATIRVDFFLPRVYCTEH